MSQSEWKQESRNGVKNHTFPANQIFHEQLCISTIMNFQWYHLNSFKNAIVNIFMVPSCCLLQTVKQQL